MHTTFNILYAPVAVFGQPIGGLFKVGNNLGWRNVVKLILAIEFNYIAHPMLSSHAYHAATELTE